MHLVYILAAMSWTVIVEDENKRPIASLGEEFTTAVDLRHAAFQLLGYLDPYGDTTFTPLQQPALLTDLHLLQEVAPDPLLDKLIALVGSQQVHTYVCFYGD